MTVFLVYDKFSGEMMGVFSSEEKAKAAIKPPAYNLTPNSYVIYERPVDE